MKRALILIIVLTVSCLAVALSIDITQQHKALSYLEDVPAMKKAVKEGRMDEALTLQKKLLEEWEADVIGLNCLISHHHTREATESIVVLGTALEQNWSQEALQALDHLEIVFSHIEGEDFCRWENFL